MRLHPPNSDTPYNGTRLSKFIDSKDTNYKKNNKITK